MRADHPLRRALKSRVDGVLRGMDSLFTQAYSKQGRPSGCSRIAARQGMRECQQSLGYTISQRVRKRIEECVGWLKTIAGRVRSRWVGRGKLKQYFELTAAAYNLVRMTKLRPT